jgi:hypothetical protein
MCFTSREIYGMSARFTRQAARKFPIRGQSLGTPGFCLWFEVENHRIDKLDNRAGMFYSSIRVFYFEVDA